MVDTDTYDMSTAFHHRLSVHILQPESLGGHIMKLFIPITVSLFHHKSMLPFATSARADEIL